MILWIYTRLERRAVRRWRWPAVVPRSCLLLAEVPLWTWNVHLWWEPEEYWLAMRPEFIHCCQKIWADKKFSLGEVFLSLFMLSFPFFLEVCQEIWSDVFLYVSWIYSSFPCFLHNLFFPFFSSFFFYTFFFLLPWICLQSWLCFEWESYPRPPLEAPSHPLYLMALLFCVENTFMILRSEVRGEHWE